MTGRKRGNDNKFPKVGRETVNICFRLTETEKFLIQKAALLSGYKGVSAFVRDLGLEAAWKLELSEREKGRGENNVEHD